MHQTKVKILFQKRGFATDLNSENQFATETTLNNKTIVFQNCCKLWTTIFFIFNETTNEMMDFKNALQLTNQEFGLNITYELS